MTSASTFALYLLIFIPPALLIPTSSREKHIFFPDEKGVPYLINLEDSEPSDTELYSLRNQINNVQFVLYTRNNLPLGEMLKPDLHVLNETDWDSARPTRFVTHGWRSTAHSASCTTIRDAYLKVGDYNIIVIDWSDIALSFDYAWVARGVMDVGKHAGRFMTFLQEHAGLDAKSVKVIGHSLGAHVSGIAARHSIGKIAEVVGLDPAGPFFEFKGPGKRIDASDAEHVQIIHTNAGRLGHRGNIGTSDFFPNGGESQPGCGLDLFYACSHSRSYYFYAESVLNPVGFPATTMDNDLRRTLNSDVFMGGPVLDTKAKGPYTLETNGSPPYAKG